MPRNSAAARDNESAGSSRRPGRTFRVAADRHDPSERFRGAGTVGHRPTLVAAFEEDQKRFDWPRIEPHHEYPHHRLRLPGRATGRPPRPGRRAGLRHGPLAGSGRGDRPARASSRSSPTCSGPRRWIGCPRPIGSSMRWGSTDQPGRRCGTVYVDGLQNVLDRLPDSVRRFVYASSTGVYGQAGGEWVDEDVADRARSTSRAGSSWRPRGASASGPTGAGSRRSSCGSRDCTDPAGSCAGRCSSGPSRSPAIPRSSSISSTSTTPPQAAAAALDAEHPDLIYLVADDRPVTRREYYSVAARLIGAPEPRFEPPRPGSPESARDATNKRIANRRMKSGLGVVLRYPDIMTGLAHALGNTAKEAGGPARR